MHEHDDRHHLRNTLAVIRAMVRRTADEAASVEDYAARLDGRLAAYTQVQADVARDGVIDLEMMIADELLRFALPIGGEVVLTGPSVKVAGHAAGLLVLAIHELACAHALDDRATRAPLSVSWTRRRDGGLKLCWEAAATYWPRWLEQALDHQLGGSIEPLADARGQGALIRLPADCCLDR